MADYSIGDSDLGLVRPSSMEEFVEIAKGRSIVSVGDWGGGRFELGLSGDLMLRIFGEGSEIEVNLVSTTNPDEIPPLVLAFGNLPQRVPIHIIEDKLNGLRTLHAIFYLIQNDRASDLEAFLVSNPDGDIEKSLLNEEDQLYVESISYGSWLLAIWAKTTKAYKSVSSVAGLVLYRGREAYLRRLEAEARLVDNQADKEAIQVARDAFDLRKSQMDYLIEVSNKINEPEIREQLKVRMLQSVDQLSLGDSEQRDPSRMLPNK